MLKARTTYCLRAGGHDDLSFTLVDAVVAAVKIPTTKLWLLQRHNDNNNNNNNNNHNNNDNNMLCCNEMKLM